VEIVNSETSDVTVLNGHARSVKYSIFLTNKSFKFCSISSKKTIKFFLIYQVMPSGVRSRRTY